MMRSIYMRLPNKRLFVNTKRCVIYAIVKIYIFVNKLSFQFYRLYLSYL